MQWKLINPSYLIENAIWRQDSSSAAENVGSTKSPETIDGGSRISRLTDLPLIKKKIDSVS